jgi:hypothetical protein
MMQTDTKAAIQVASPAIFNTLDFMLISVVRRISQKFAPPEHRTSESVPVVDFGFELTGGSVGGLEVPETC